MSTAAATGPTIESDDFSFKAPEGWEQNEEFASGALVFALDPEDVEDGFADNVNVIEDPTLEQTDDLDAIRDGVKRSLEAGNASDIVVADGTVDIDGEQSVQVSSVFSLNGIEYAVHQYAVKHDGAGYIITFSYSLDRPKAEQVEIAESVVAGWSWAA